MVSTDIFIKIVSRLKWALMLVCLGAVLAVAGPSGATTDLNITNTTVQPATMSSCPGSTVEAFVFKITNNHGTTQYINSMNLNFNGTGSLNDGTVSFYQDTNNNGVVDGSDVSLTADLMMLGSTTIYCELGAAEPAIPPGGSLSFIMTITFNGTAPIGKTYQINMGAGLDMDSTGTGTTYTPTITDTSTSPMITLTACGGSTPTSTLTSTASNTKTSTPALTATFTLTGTNTPTATGTPTTPVHTATPTLTATNTSTATMNNSSTFTQTPLLTSTPTSTCTLTVSYTPTLTFTASHTPTITNTLPPSLTPTRTTSFTATPSPTVTCTFTPTALTKVIFTPPYPNPSTGGPIGVDVTTPSAATIELEIFTTAMRKICERTFTASGSGGVLGITTHVEWDLRDRVGMTASNGLYYLQLRVTGSHPTTQIIKVLLLR